MAKTIIGHIACPECEFADAEVGVDKNGNPYRYCPECNAQYFTRGDARRAANLKSKMRPIAPVGGEGAGAAGANPPSPAPTTTEKRHGKATIFG
jgi:hypothetical protein